MVTIETERLHRARVVGACAVNPDVPSIAVTNRNGFVSFGNAVATRVHLLISRFSLSRTLPITIDKRILSPALSIGE